MHSSKDQGCIYVRSSLGIITQPVVWRKRQSLAALNSGRRGSPPCRQSCGQYDRREKGRPRRDTLLEVHANDYFNLDWAGYGSHDSRPGGNPNVGHLNIDRGNRGNHQAGHRDIHVGNCGKFHPRNHNRPTNLRSGYRTRRQIVALFWSHPNRLRRLVANHSEGNISLLFSADDARDVTG